MFFLLLLGQVENVPLEQAHLDDAVCIVMPGFNMRDMFQITALSECVTTGYNS